jgi:hypothetical protein
MSNTARERAARAKREARGWKHPEEIRVGDRAVNHHCPPKGCEYTIVAVDEEAITIRCVMQGREPRVAKCLRSRFGQSYHVEAEQ